MRDVARGLALVTGLVLAAGCSGSGASYPLLVGSDGVDGAIFLPEPDATVSPLLVLVTPTAPVLCAGQCVALTQKASGGVAPYTYQWDHDLTADAGVVEVCPTETTTYTVRATDSSGAIGEGSSPGVTGSASVVVMVTAPCADSGPPTRACDSVASDVSPSGVNPSGAWSYGWSMALGSTFTIYTSFTPATQPDAAQPVLATWYYPMNNDDLYGNLPSVTFNPSSVEVHPAAGLAGVTTTVQPGQLQLAPGPMSQYSIARWTAAAAGRYSVKATFTGLEGYMSDKQTTTDVHVQHDQVDIAAGYLNLNGMGNVFSVSSDLSVASGDTVDFVLGDGMNDYLWDATGLDAVICEVDAGDGG